MTQAPETPTTHELHSRYPVDDSTIIAVKEMRKIVTNALNNYEINTVGVVGYCARPNAEQAKVILEESGLVDDVHDPDNGLVALHRGPMWKPRSNSEDWHGEETTDPAGAYSTMHDQAARYANLAVEIGHRYHLARYGHLLSFMWTGGRSINNPELIKAAALDEPEIPLAIKNGLDGTIDQALEQVERATELRQGEGAPVILLYRGGEKATSPEAWEETVIDVHERTSGRFILDTAHGTEMAHDPNRNFGKSVDGQILALYSMHRLARQGYKFAGSMMEASRLLSPTDPHMPLSLALSGLKEQHRLKRQPREVIYVQPQYSVYP